MKRIIGLGSLAMDIMLQVAELPAEDGFALINNTSTVHGGSAANVITQATRLGAETGFIAQIGDDSVGVQLRDTLRQEGIDVSAMPVKKGGVSLHTNIVVDQRGSKFIMLNMGDCFLDLRPEQIDTDYLCAGDIFYTDLLPKDAALFALKKAKQAGLTTVFNLQLDLGTMQQFGIGADTIFEALEYVDIFAPCRQGLHQLYESTCDSECIEKYQAQYSGLLVLTLGAEGALGVSPSENARVSAHPVKVVDTTGAGDSFLGAFMYSYLIAGSSLRDALQFSSVAAGLTCTKLGARQSPVLAQVISQL